MKYNSPFDNIIISGDFQKDYEDIYKYLFFQNNNRELLRRVKETVYSSKARDIEIVTFPTQLIKAMLDYKIDNFESIPIDKHLNVLHESSEMLKYIYMRNLPEAQRKFVILEEMLEESYGEKFFDEKARIDYDNVTTVSSMAQHSKRSVNLLENELKSNEPILFIPLVYGGLPAGMDVYLRYTCPKDIHEQSYFHPIRFSLHKSKDKIPHILPHEYEFIQSLAENKKVVIFDEDRNTGHTMSKAMRFIKDITGGEVYGLVNHDRGLNQSYFGKL